MKAIYIEHPGGVDALKYGDRPVPEPAAEQALVKLAYTGVNFIDTYHRSGLYPLPIPAVIGTEGAGIVEKVAEGVTTVKPGDRVAYAMSPGSDAEYAAVPVKLLVPVPDEVELNVAAAAMLQGMTAHYLTQSTFPLKPGHTALVHAAAGGTGRLVVQMAKQAGATVIGTVGTEEKAELARSDGADHAIIYSDVDFVKETKAFTGGRGVDVVYDGVGKSTFMKSLDCLAPRGMMVTFGNASGPVDPVPPLLLSQKGSLFLTRPNLGHYIADREDLEWRTNDLFTWIAEGRIHINIQQTYPLAEAAKAHKALEGRKTTGKLILKID